MVNTCSLYIDNNINNITRNYRKKTKDDIGGIKQTCKIYTMTCKQNILHTLYLMCISNFFGVHQFHTWYVTTHAHNVSM